MNKKGHLITSAIEHHCVINSFKALEDEGFKTTFVGVDNQGFININQLKKSVRPETILISVMLANNEIGTIEPIAEIGKWLKGENQRRRLKHQAPIIFHTDACQAAGFLDLNVEKLGVDLMSVNGSKIYGPKQTGFLYVRSGVKIKPQIFGGGQEADLRSGTENVPGIVGLAKAFELGQKNRNNENKRLAGLRDYLSAKLFKRIPNALLNGPDSKVLKDKRLPNNINLTIKGIDGEALMLYLDSYGISASTSSACSTGTTEASHVLLGLGRGQADAKSSIRLTLGKHTNKNELNYVIKVLPDLVKELRKVYPPKFFQNLRG
jgi:cysteine desulfurase